MSRVLVAVALGLLALVPAARAHVKRSASRWSFDGLGLPTLAFNGIGRSGTGVLKGRRHGSGHPEGGASAPSSCSGTRPSTSASTPAAPVDDQDYRVPFRFTGKLAKLTDRKSVV